MNMVRKKKTELEEAQTGAWVDQKDLGKLGFVPLVDSTLAKVTDTLPTGLSQLDAQLNGGIPLGRIIELYSAENVGKSTLAYQINRMANKVDVPVIWFDVEGTASASHLAEVGVDINKTIVWQPTDGDANGASIENVAQRMEDAMNYYEKEHNQSIVMVWDSIGGTSSESTLTKGYDDKQPGQNAKAITLAFSKLIPVTQRTGSTILVINQVREKIGGMAFGDNTDTPGGKALKHAASVRIKLGKNTAIKRRGENFGHKVQMTLKKSKVSVPNTKSDSYLYGTFGMGEMQNIAFEAIELGIIKKGTAGNILVPDEDGEVITYKRDDFMDAIAEFPEEYIETMRPIFEKITVANFPNDYPALYNETVNIDNIPLMENLREVYVKVSEDNVKAREEDVEAAKERAAETKVKAEKLREKVSELKEESKSGEETVEMIKEQLKDESDKAKQTELRNLRKETEATLKKNLDAYKKKSSDLLDLKQKESKDNIAIRKAETELAKAQEIYDLKHPEEVE